MLYNLCNADVGIHYKNNFHRCVTWVKVDLYAIKARERYQSQSPLVQSKRIIKRKKRPHKGVNDYCL